MGRFIIKKILSMVVTFFGITLLVYIMSTLMPGGPLEILASNPNMTAEDVERYKVALGLDKPVIVQYFNWLMELLKGNLGYSYRTNTAVLELVLERLGPSLILAGAALLLSVIIAIPIGIYTSLKPHGAVDSLVSGFSFVGSAIPNYFIGLVLIFFFGVKLKLLPMGGMYDSNADPNLGSLIRHLIMPTVSLSLMFIATWMRQTRSEMMDILRCDFIRTAKSKGLGRRTVVMRHALRNALTPIITVVSMSIPVLISGAIVTEQVFSWPGIGSLMIESINSRDYSTIMGITVFVAVIVLVVNLITELLYGILDPRIRMQ